MFDYIPFPVFTHTHSGDETLPIFLFLSYLIFFFIAQEPPVDQGLLIIEASRSHSDTPHSVGLLSTSDQPDAETCT